MKMTTTRLLSLLVLVATVFVTGCATKFERQAFNSEAATHVKKITVSQWSDQEEYPVFIVNHPGNNLGLIGAIAAAADRTSKTKRVNDLLEPAKTKLTSTFYDKALPSLKSLGYDTLSVSAKRSDKLDDVRIALAKDQGQHAILLLTLDASYLAAGMSTDYFPAVVLGAELTDSKSKAVLYREQYHYGYNNGVKEVSHIDAAATCRFKDIDTLTANIDITRKCMTDSVDVLLNQLLNDLKR